MYVYLKVLVLTIAYLQCTPVLLELEEMLTIASTAGLWRGDSFNTGFLKLFSPLKSTTYLSAPALGSRTEIRARPGDRRCEESQRSAKLRAQTAHKQEPNAACNHCDARGGEWQINCCVPPSDNSSGIMLPSKSDPKKAHC